MRFGVHLAASGPLGTPDRIGAIADSAEALGFDSVWVSDHVAYPVGFTSTYPYGRPESFNQETAHYYDPLSTLAWVGGRTTRVRLGISVLVVPMRNPVYLAKQTATIDRLTGGRLLLGIGVGWQREEFQALGVTTFERRGAVTDEWIRLARRLWSEEPVQHQGQFYQHGPIIVKPGPARPAGPPILVGGNGPRALRRTVELGDGWHAIRISVNELAAGTARLREMAAAAGRDPSTIEVGLRADAVYGAEPPDDADWWIHGPNAAERIRAYQRAGCQELLFGIAPATSIDTITATMQWLANDVLPKVGD